MLVLLSCVYNYPMAMHASCTCDFIHIVQHEYSYLPENHIFEQNDSMHNANDLHCLCPSQTQFMLLQQTDTSFATTSMSTFITCAVNFWYLIHLEISKNSHQSCLCCAILFSNDLPSFGWALLAFNLELHNQIMYQCCCCSAHFFTRTSNFPCVIESTKINTFSLNVILYPQQKAMLLNMFRRHKSQYYCNCLLHATCHNT